MNFLDDVLDNFTERVNQISSINSVNDELMSIIQKSYKVILDDLRATGKYRSLIQKVERQTETYKYATNIPELEQTYAIIRQQVVVLIVGAIENFFTDIFRAVADNQPSALKWDNSKERISFDPALLSTTVRLSDIVINHLKNKDISFQDLKSALNAISKYIGCDFIIDEDIRDELILASAWRNIIVHNRSEIDDSFLKQVRGTKYSATYTKGKYLEVSEADIQNLIGSSYTFTSSLIDSINISSAGL